MGSAFKGRHEGYGKNRQYKDQLSKKKFLEILLSFATKNYCTVQVMRDSQQKKEKEGVTFHT